MKIGIIGAMSVETDALKRQIKDAVIETVSGIEFVSGKLYGTLTDVMNRGASDVYEIKTATGEVLMPAVDEFVKEVDLEKGIFITPIEGMFPDEI